jgi:hypothetical protein
MFVISGFCCDVNEICALLGYYAASNGIGTIAHCIIPQKSADLRVVCYYFSHIVSG